MRKLTLTVAHPDDAAVPDANPGAPYSKANTHPANTLVSTGYVDVVHT